MGSVEVLVHVLIKRLGGRVTLTEAEIREVGDWDRIKMTRSQSLQDDTLTLEVQHVSRRDGT